MTNNVEPGSPLSRKNALSFLSDCYRSYRQWQKAKGREKKAKKRLQKMVGFYSGFIKKGDMCFDVGANLGDRTEAFLKLGAKVVVVEPQEDCIKTLKDKFGDNENVFIVPKALDKAVAAGVTASWRRRTPTRRSCWMAGVGGGRTSTRWRTG